jgi:hypothetical protein
VHRGSGYFPMTTGAVSQLRSARAQRALDWYNAHRAGGGQLDPACLKVDPTG